MCFGWLSASGWEVKAQGRKVKCGAKRGETSDAERTRVWELHFLPGPEEALDGREWASPAQRRPWAFTVTDAGLQNLLLLFPGYVLKPRHRDAHWPALWSTALPLAGSTALLDVEWGWGRLCAF